MRRAGQEKEKGREWERGKGRRKGWGKCPRDMGTAMGC